MSDRDESSQTYSIVLKGALSDSVVAAIGGSRPTTSNTTIIVAAQDRAALHSVINRIEDFALELVSVTPVDSAED